MSAQTKIGLIAGSGLLPQAIAATDRDMPVVLLKNHANPNDFQDHPQLLTTPAKVGAVFTFFRHYGCTHILFAGGMTRPCVMELIPDGLGVKALWHCLPGFFKGDDALLRSVRSFVEGQGMSVLGADTVVQGLTLKEGEVIGLESKDRTGDDTALQKALQTLKEHALADRGQAALLLDDGTVHCETQAGTAALIDRHAGKNSILLKIMKPQQDPDLDRPVIGPDTLSHMAAKGGKGIMIESDKVYVLDRPAVTKLADQHRLFVMGVRL